MLHIPSPPAVILLLISNSHNSHHFPIYPPSLTCLSQQSRYSEGDYIIRQGATGDTFYIISSGQVRMRMAEPYLELNKQASTSGGQK